MVFKNVTVEHILGLSVSFKNRVGFVACMTDRKKILVVDDEEDLREILSQFLTEKCGYEVECASSGLEGTAALKGDPPYSGMGKYDGYVLDQILGDSISGSNLAVLIRLEHEDPPIVMFTATMFSVDRAMLGYYQNIDYVQKPADLGVFKSIFERYFQDKNFKTAHSTNV
jgi:DNA-binding response OmpR family regulator